MPVFGPINSPAAVGRLAFGAATIVAAVFGLVLGDGRFFVASGAFGTVWWAWDLLCETILAPVGRFLTGAITGTSAVEDPPDLTLDDTVRLLERHLEADGVPRHVQIQSALRLAEIYRLNRHDPARADDVIRRVREKWPDAKELERVERGGDEVMK